jgi:dTDP-4-amino-4,6-dideoxygalactose transaminase
VTDDDELAAEMRLLRDHGRSGHGGEVQRWGMNSRLDTLHAAVLRVKLRHYASEVSHRRSIAAIYEQGLSGISELRTPPGPVDDGPHFDVFQNYEIVVERRDALRTWLETQGVRTIMQWAGKGLHQFPSLGLSAVVPNADRFFRGSLLLPMNSSVTAEEARRVTELVRQFVLTT